MIDGDTRPSVAIVGAGIAGLACARRLRGDGLAVTLFDKGSRPGGRCATRQAGVLAFDHGAQYVTASDAGFSRVITAAELTGAARRWPTPLACLGADGGRSDREDHRPERWVGAPAMQSFAAYLADGLAVQSRVRIERVERAGSGWHLMSADGAPAGPFTTVVVAVPAPQAITLLAAAPALAKRAADARLAPCWALMASFAEPLAVPFDAATLDGGPLAWICNDSRKPGRARGTGDDLWVVHAGPDWSRAHLEDPPAQVIPALVRAFADRLGRALPPPAYATAHRWRFARVETPLGEPCLYDPAIGLGACGDWCLGPRIEAAYLSGQAMAERVLAAS